MSDGAITTSWTSLAAGGVSRRAHRRQAVLAEKRLHHDVMDRVPERDGNRFAAQFP